jgi:hypothetical protein
MRKPSLLVTRPPVRPTARRLVPSSRMFSWEHVAAAWPRQAGEQRKVGRQCGAFSSEKIGSLVETAMKRPRSWTTGRMPRPSWPLRINQSEDGQERERPVTRGTL